MRYSTILALVSVTIAAPLAQVKRDDVVPGKYIVKLKGDINTLANDELKASISATPDFEYSLPGFRGFASTLSDEELAKLQASNQVRHWLLQSNGANGIPGRLYRAGYSGLHLGDH